MLTENDVVQAVCNHLERDGWVIEQRCTTQEHGIDIIARKQGNSGRLLIEAKGETSSRDGSARFGKPFTAAQVFDRVAKGFYTAMCLQEIHAKDGDSIGMAFPSNDLFAKYLAPLKNAAGKTGIRIFLVGRAGTVTEALRDTARKPAAAR